MLFSGSLAKTYHTFQPCHETTIQEVNLGGYKYWAYYLLSIQPYETHLARSNSLDGSWDDYGKVFDGRWASVYYDGSIFTAFYGDKDDDYICKRGTSEDGIAWTYQETIADVGNNTYLWKNPNDNFWYLFSHISPPHKISYKKSLTLDGFGAAQSIDIFDLNGAVVAAPCVYYRNGIYWLAVETYPGSVWNTEVYWSTAINGYYRAATNKVILTNEDACYMHFPVNDTLYAWYAEMKDIPNQYWDIVLRTATLT